MLQMRPSLVNHFLLVLSLSDLLLLICNFFFLIFPVIALKSQSAFLHNAYPLILWCVIRFQLKLVEAKGVNSDFHSTARNFFHFELQKKEQI